MDIQQALMEILFGRATGESPADAELNRQGSLMGSQRTQQRQSEARQGPALSTLSKAVDFANPINWMGGFGGQSAMLGPIRNAAQRQIVKSLHRGAPDLLESLRSIPQKVHFNSEVPLSNPMASGQKVGGLATPDFNISINPSVLRGRLPQAVQQTWPDVANMTGNQTMFANLPAVVGHEAQHIANDPLVRGQIPDSMVSLARQIRDAMAKQPGGDQLIDVWRGGSGGIGGGVDEALAYLRQHQIAKTPNSLLQELTEALKPR